MELDQLTSELLVQYKKALAEMRAKYPHVNEDKRELLIAALQMFGFGNNQHTIDLLRFTADMLDSEFGRNLRDHHKMIEAAGNN